ncbi:hypothetical protein A9K55_003026 [Cordyceps militaris]|uniref:Uncharacterized protein n=1 Tax=Cordyceps militaris TaxID=73501 RepID=A0A2H4S8M6_CORMI|nr:hypothetical protein A9K55_003026 [Cordyceps militaris]
MWDVVWTDPSKELVGEHRAKKDQLRHDKEKSSIRSGRDSATTSSSNSSSETPFSFFRPRSAKNAVTLKGKDIDRSPSFSGLATPSLTSTLSPFSQTFDSSSRRSSGMVTTAPTSPTKDGPDAHFSSSDRDTLPSFDECLSQSFGSIDSITAKLTSSGPKGSGAEAPNIATLIQMLGDLPLRAEIQDIPRSVPNNTETAGKSRETEGDLLSSIGAPLVTPPKSPSKPYANSPNGTARPYANNHESLQRFSRSEASSETPLQLTPPPKSPWRPAPPPLEINNPAAWRTPSQWKEHDVTQTRKSSGSVLKNIGKENAIKTEAFAIPDAMTGVRSAAGAPTGMILAKVKQVFASRPGEDQEVGTESSKQHWMLSLLHGLGYIADPDHDQDCHNSALPASALVMLLYETKAYATYISTVHPDSQVYHLSRESSPTSWSHNIQSVRAPPAAATCFPVAPRLFQTVYSFSLPSGCPYHVLPNVLSSVYKSLKPGGSFKVTIIDPLPYADTLGHKLRSWMEKHLFPNLERHQRCLEPSRLFPKLLGDAGLRGKGSRRTKVKFFALQENARGFDDRRDPDRSLEKLYQERRDKAELRSLVGRMFWMEVWGRYVTPASTWWWDDPECVAECLELGTFWEYHIIDSAKVDETVG